MIVGNDQLIVQQAGGVAYVLTLDAPVFRIGRTPENNLPLPHETVSEYHAELRVSSEGWVLRDLTSLNGTFVDNVRLTPLQPRLLTNGTSFRIDPYTLTFQATMAPIIEAASSSALNPYIFGNPVKGAEMFFGRNDLFHFLRQTLVRHHVVVLFGQQRSGKTSVLYQANRHLDSRFLCVLIDLQGFQFKDIESFLYELARYITRDLKRDYQINVPTPEKRAFLADARDQFKDELLDRVWEAIGDKHLLLMMDESVLLFEKARDGERNDLAGYLLHLVQYYDRLHLLFSLDVGKDEIGDEVGTLFRAGIIKKMSFLSHDATIALITEPASAFYSVEPDAIDRIFHLTSGHPYYTQLLCSTIFMYWQEQHMPRIREVDVDEILSEAVQQADQVIKHLWIQLSAGEMAVIAAMAATIAEPAGSARETDIRRVWAQHDVSLPYGELARAIKRLVERDIIIEHDHEEPIVAHGRENTIAPYSQEEAYAFTVDLQRLWVRKNQKLPLVKDALADSIAVWMTPRPPPRPIEDVRISVPTIYPSPPTVADTSRPAPLPPYSPPVPPSVTLPEPETAASGLLLNRYRVEGVLGEGGAGNVVRAFDTRLKRLVAIKTLRHSFLSLAPEEFRQVEDRFVREAEAGSRMGSHPNIVGVYDLVVDQDGSRYLILEFVPGGTLAERIRKQPLLLAQALAIAADITRGLIAVHDAGLVHRDVKPANIFIAADGRAQVGDFGIAQIDDLSGRTHTTVRHPGTPLYMSPEQERFTGYLRPQSDQYTLGLVFFEMLAGKPFKRMGTRESSAFLARHPPPVSALLARMLEDDPDERFSEMTTVLREIQAIRRMELPEPPDKQPDMAAASLPYQFPIGEDKGTQAAG